ncbi:MAG: PQQ-dependent sugar dehydrogenase [Planctomycetota bacterium]
MVKFRGFRFTLALLVCVGLTQAVGTQSALAGAVALDTRRVASGLTRPVFCTAPPGDLERLFIVEQTGRIKILMLETGTVLTTPFLNISSLVSPGISGGDERGFLGMAFHPDYATNNFFYVYYYTTSSTTRVARYTVDPLVNPDVAIAASATPIITISQPQSNHNGGTIAFSPIDGYLYVGLGDGGNFDDTGAGHATGGNAQSGATLLGKMLRIDVDGGSPYVIPADNPFVSDPTHLDEIWAKGVRNPYRWSFDRLTGDMYIGDVGQDAREEIDFEFAGVGGRNYGWRCAEGFICTGLSGCTCPGPSIVSPVHDFSHAAGHCSGIGGYVYRGCAMPAMHGVYFFGDYCSSALFSFRINVAGTGITELTTRTSELVPPAGQGTISTIAGFGEDGYGEIYICDLGGEVFKIVPFDIATLDCDGDFIVDACESGTVPTDCNGNMIDDTCEIASGQATDCNSNGIPDDCDLTSGVLVDCDSNDEPDLCEIEAGTAADCNANQIPDSCDITSGVLTDANGDGFPDECPFFIMRAMNASGAPGQTGVAQFVAGTFPEVVNGYSVALDFNEAVLSVSAVDLTGTVALGADFFAPNFNNAPGQGWLTAGVVIDISPPIVDTLAPGVDQPLVRSLFTVAPGAVIGSSSTLTITTIGNPAVVPIFSVGTGIGEVPNLVSGVFNIAGGALFRRGDSNVDGLFNIADPVYTLNFLFSAGTALSCADAGDSNDDGTLNIADPVHSLAAQFSAGPMPPSPHPGCGSDPTADALTCGAYAACP